MPAIPAGGFDFVFKVAGERQIFDTLGILSDRVEDWRPAWDKIHDDFTGHIMVRQFATQGARGPAGRWINYIDEPVYASIKHRVLGRKFPVLRWATSHGPPQAGEKLYPSLVDQNDPNHVWQRTTHSFRVGTSVPYAIKHQTGQGMQPYDMIPLPQRKIIDLNDDDRHRWERVLQHHVLGSIPANQRRAMRLDARSGGFYGADGRFYPEGS